MIRHVTFGYLISWWALVNVENDSYEKAKWSLCVTPTFISRKKTEVKSCSQHHLIAGVFFYPNTLQVQTTLEDRNTRILQLPGYGRVQTAGYRDPVPDEIPYSLHLYILDIRESTEDNSRRWKSTSDFHILPESHESEKWNNPWTSVSYTHLKLPTILRV